MIMNDGKAILGLVVGGCGGGGAAEEAEGEESTCLKLLFGLCRIPSLPPSPLSLSSSIYSTVVLPSVLFLMTA